MVKQNAQLVSVMLLAMLMVVGCNPKNRENLMPPITGKPGEVTLVIKEDIYKGEIGDSLVAILTQVEPALPQSMMEGAEAMFDLVQIPPQSFSNIFKSNRNLIIVEINDDLQKPVIKVQRDYWAKGQLIIRMGAPDKKSMIKLIEENYSFLPELLVETEIERQVKLNLKYENMELARKLEENHNVRAHFPKGFNALVDSGNFMWIQYEPKDLILGVLLWHYPYTDESQLDYENLIIKTEEMLQPRVPGSTEGSYMALELDYPVLSEEREHKGHYVRELRGLWQMENGFMGGPFISWSLVDEERSRIVTLFGFVFAPRTEKRNYIRKVESLIRTVDFVPVEDQVE